MENFKVIIATEIDTGKTVYLGTDERSGGYPYWSSTIFGAKRSISNRDIEEVSADFGKQEGYTYRKNLVNPRIATIGIISEESIDLTMETSEEKLAKVLAKLSSDEIEVLKENL